MQRKLPKLSFLLCESFDNGVPHLAQGDTSSDIIVARLVPNLVPQKQDVRPDGVRTRTRTSVDYVFAQVFEVLQTPRQINCHSGQTKSMHPGHAKSL